MARVNAEKREKLKEYLLKSDLTAAEISNQLQVSVRQVKNYKKRFYEEYAREHEKYRYDYIYEMLSKHQKTIQDAELGYRRAKTDEKEAIGWFKRLQEAKKDYENFLFKIGFLAEVPKKIISVGVDYAELLRNYKSRISQDSDR